MAARLVGGQDQKEPAIPDLLHDAGHDTRRIAFIVRGIDRKHRRLDLVQARRRVIVGTGRPLPQQIIRVRRNWRGQLRINELVGLFPC